MPLRWPTLHLGNSELTPDEERSIRAALDRVGDMVEAQLGAAGLRPHASPLFRDWNLFVFLTKEHAQVVFTSSQGGVPGIRWRDARDAPAHTAINAFTTAVREQTGHTVVAELSLAIDTNAERELAITDESLATGASEHVSTVLRQHRLNALEPLDNVQHLAPSLGVFLDDHPDFAHNVFIMMRFIDTEPMRSIHKAITDELASHGFNGLRADDKDYTGELWTNVQVYLHGCKFGIAVFEDVEERSHNPNIALELGYMLALGRRSLILKEARLPRMPTDVVHRLYKPFDAFDIERTVRNQVRSWVTVDLN